MKPPTPIDNLDEPVARHARRDFVAVRAHQTVQQALDSIRTTAADGNLVYFYVTDDTNRLAGVIQTRKLLTSPLDCRVDSIMTKSVVAIPEAFTLLDACELFVVHKFLAFPVVDKDRRILGVIDIGVFTEEMFDVEEREQTHNVFETLGVRLSERRDKSVWSGFRSRFPWLLGTIASGTACALLVGFFQVTLAKSLILAFFLTMVLGLGESVSMQTLALTVHVLHHQGPQRDWFWPALRRELQRTLFVALACGLIVGGIAVAWRHEVLAGLVIAGGVLMSLLVACFLGVSVPVLLHRLRLDLRIASGPVTLALTDVCTIAVYFTLAAAVLGR